ncbi:MAG: hypothetical protein K8Q89_06225 [Nitrosarchaeum sp.]|nr:hypothetical protein [Nitrosarchaeum sp.]
MNKTPDQIKNIVEDWIKIVGKPYEDVTKKDPNFGFGFKMGDIVIYSMKNRADRVTVETFFGFASEHKTATANLGDKEWQEFAVSIGEPLSLANLSLIIGQEQSNPKQINHMFINGYVDVESMNREKFFRVWDAVANFRQITIKKIQIKFGVKGAMESGSNTSSPSMYG